MGGWGDLGEAVDCEVAGPHARQRRKADVAGRGVDDVLINLVR